MDAVISLSGHGENASNAMKSVLNNYNDYSKVHIVCAYYEADKEPFEGFHQLRKEIESNGVPVVICSSFNDDDCPSVKGDCRVNLHPYCVLRTGGMGMIKKSIDELEKTKNTSVMHFGISTPMIVRENAFVQDFIDAITGYGFLLITFYLDMWWRIYSRGKHYLSTDVRVGFICTTYKRKFVPQLSRSSRLWDNEQYPYRYGGDAAILKPERKMRGFALARYILNTHNKQVFGAWLLMFCFFFYFWMSVPWWNYLAITPTTANFGPDSSMAARGVVQASNMFVRPLFGPLNFVLYLFNTSVLYMSASYYYMLPHQLLLCLLHPVYMTLYPLFWLYARLYRPKDTWTLR